MTHLIDEKHLLLVDDDEDDFLFLKEVLETHFPSVIISYLANCTVANKTDFNGIDLVLLDINMPKFTGFECLDLIRQEYRLTNLPVVMYSNSVATRDVRNAYDKGANLFVHKPVSFNDIKLLIGHILSIDWSNIEEITRQNRAINKILLY